MQLSQPLWDKLRAFTFLLLTFLTSPLHLLYLLEFSRDYGRNDWLNFIKTLHQQRTNHNCTFLMEDCPHPNRELCLIYSTYFLLIGKFQIWIFTSSCTSALNINCGVSTSILTSGKKVNTLPHGFLSTDSSHITKREHDNQEKLMRVGMMQLLLHVNYLEVKTWIPLQFHSE